MKKLIFILFAALSGSSAFAQSAKVVVDSKGEAHGYYIRTNANTYTVLYQDDAEVPIKGHKIVTFSAENGQGYLSPKNEGAVNVRSTPSTSGAKIGTLSWPDGDMPDDCKCLGKKDGWYKVRLNSGKIGYIREDLVEWSAFGADGPGPSAVEEFRKELNSRRNY